MENLHEKLNGAGWLLLTEEERRIALDNLSRGTKKVVDK